MLFDGEYGVSAGGAGGAAAHMHTYTRAAPRAVRCTRLPSHTHAPHRAAPRPIPTIAAQNQQGGGGAYYPTPGYAPQGGAFAGAVAPYSQHAYYPQAGFAGGGAGGGRGGGYGYDGY